MNMGTCKFTHMTYTDIQRGELEPKRCTSIGTYTLTVSQMTTRRDSQHTHMHTVSRAPDKSGYKCKLGKPLA